MSTLKKLKDSIPSYDDVTSNPWRWIGANPGAKRAHSIEQGAEDRSTALKKRLYDESHPEPNMPSRTETDLNAKRTAARRRSTGGRIDTILSDEGLG